MYQYADQAHTEPLYSAVHILLMNHSPWRTNKGKRAAPPIIGGTAVLEKVKRLAIRPDEPGCKQQRQPQT